MAAPSRVRTPAISINTSNALNRVTVSWTPPLNNGGSRIRNYAIQFKIGATGVYSGVAASPLPKTGFPTTATTRSITHTLGTGAATLNKQVFYRVAAINNRGELGVWTQLGPVVPLSAVPAAPTITSIAASGPNSATITIAAPASVAPITLYRVHCRIVNTLNSTVVTVTPTGTTTVAQITGLTAGATYEFAATASSMNGIGPLSAFVGRVRIIDPAAIPTISTISDVARDPMVAIRRYHGMRVAWNNNHTGSLPVHTWTIQLKLASSSTWIRWTLSDGDPNVIKKTNMPNYRHVDFFTDQAPYLDNAMTGLPQGVYNVRIRGVNTDGSLGYSAISTFDTTRNPVFNRTSLDNQAFNIPARHRRLINNAIDIWETYIRYNKNDFASIKSSTPSWNGMEIVLWYPVNQQGGFIAAAYVDSGFDRPGIKCLPQTYGLIYNAYFESMSDEWWIKVWLHELGHALGIGTMWNTDYAPGCTGHVSPANNLLNGSSYTNAQAAYNSLTRVTRSYIPLEADGGDGTAGGHWEDQFRAAGPSATWTYPGSGFNYPALPTELMIGYMTGTNFLTQLTIKALVDFGLEEVIPGTSQQSNPPVAVGITTQMQTLSSARKYVCGGVRKLPTNLT